MFIGLYPPAIGSGSPPWGRSRVICSQELAAKQDPQPEDRPKQRHRCWLLGVSTPGAVYTVMAKGSERRLAEQGSAAAKGVVAILDAGQEGLVEEMTFE